MDTSTQTEMTLVSPIVCIDKESIADVMDDGVICCCPTHDGINEKATQSEVITKGFLETGDDLRQMFASLRIFWKGQERMLTELGLTKAEIDIYYDGAEDEKNAVMTKVEYLKSR